MPRTTTARRANTRIEAHTYRTRIVTPPIEEPHHAKHTSNTWHRRPMIVLDPPILPRLAAVCCVSRRTAASTRSRPMPNTARSFIATRQCCRCTRTGTRTLQSVAGRTRRLHPCRTCREADRQRISIVAFLPRG
jgi:hypothetical protein